MRSVLVTGGGGFVGSALVRMLLDRGYEVRVLGRREYDHIRELGVHCHVGDIAVGETLRDAFSGIDTVFHTAAKAGIWGRWEDYRDSNIVGTKNVIENCLFSGIKRLVYTSTPSVVFDSGDICGGDESLSYPQKFLCNYARSKVEAEKLVLEADSEVLHTCAIRPHLVWGPGDPHLIPRLLERGREGSLKIVGNGENMVDISYVDNVAYGHILAGEMLGKSSKIRGQAYFIGQERPVKLYHWINGLYKELGIAPVERRVPFSLAFAVGACLEVVYKLGAIEKEPKMTRFLALQLARSHYFSHARAAADFGYKPLVTLEEGQRRLIDWVRQSA
jgi:nucleoside-diphosphate-sugar epimerase